MKKSAVCSNFVQIAVGSNVYLTLQLPKTRTCGSLGSVPTILQSVLCIHTQNQANQYPYRINPGNVTPIPPPGHPISVDSMTRCRSVCFLDSSDAAQRNLHDQSRADCDLRRMMIDDITKSEKIQETGRRAINCSRTSRSSTMSPFNSTIS